jgi:ubiquinone/menaquinone biosynthesis C-methylase UbiE
MMDPHRHRLIQRRGWDRAASHYERFWSRQLLPAHEAILATAGLAPGHAVVDIACGTGVVALGAARAVGPAGPVVATDLSQRMLDETAARAVAAGLRNVTTICCGAEDLTADGPFDVSVCSLGLMYVPDPRRALAEMFRVTRPGGRIAVSVWGDRRNCGWAGVFGVVAARVSSDVCPMFFALGTPGTLAGLLEQVGFCEVEHTRLSTVLDFTDDDEALGAAFLGGPVALAYARFDGATRHGAHREYLDSLAAFRNRRGGFAVPGEFVIAGATRPHSPHDPDQEQGASP